jgi:hypothetical protein
MWKGLSDNSIDITFLTLIDFVFSLCNISVPSIRNETTESETYSEKKAPTSTSIASAIRFNVNEEAF